LCCGTGGGYGGFGGVVYGYCDGGDGVYGRDSGCDGGQFNNSITVSNYAASTRRIIVK